MGIPVSLQFTITSIGSMILQSAINSFGSTAVAAITAAGKVEQITNIPMSALGVANSTFVAQNYGAGNYKRIVASVRKNTGFGFNYMYYLQCCFDYCRSLYSPIIYRKSVQEIMGYSKQYLYTIGGCYSLVSPPFCLQKYASGAWFYLCKYDCRSRRACRKTACCILLYEIFRICSSLFCRSCCMASCRYTAYNLVFKG